MARTTRIVIALITFLLGTLWLAGQMGAQTERPPSTGRADTARGDVIMMRCATDGSKFVVTAFDGSAQAPGKKSDNCPEQLSLLFREGFVARDFRHSDIEKKYLVVTLVR
jgi:hypothetical protein